jgi:D-ribose pyranase
MILKGLLNPQILSLLARVRHTNLLVIADRGFPYWPQIETVDLSLVDDMPKVAQVVEALRVNHHFGEAWMAKEFAQNNSPAIQASFSQLLSGLEVKEEGAIRHRLDPHGRHDALRQYHSGFGVKFIVASSLTKPLDSRDRAMDAFARFRESNP